jgi:hypothetical protein
MLPALQCYLVHPLQHVLDISHANRDSIIICLHYFCQNGIYHNRIYKTVSRLQRSYAITARSYCTPVFY